MTVYNNLIQKRNELRVKRDQKGLTTLQTIIGEVERSVDANNREDDAAVTKVLKTLLKRWEEAATFELQYEIDILRVFVPLNLTEAQLVDIKNSVQPANLGAFMKHLKDNYANAYDGALARKVYEYD